MPQPQPGAVRVLAEKTSAGVKKKKSMTFFLLNRVCVCVYVCVFSCTQKSIQDVVV